jgi:hypothetical protein
MYFEVTIPDARSQTVNALQIDARTWRSALATAFAQTGAQPLDLSGAFVMLDGPVLHVLDRRDRRVIHVRRMPDNQVQHARLIKTGAQPAVGGSGGKVGFTDKATGSFRAISAPTPSVAPAPASPILTKADPNADGRVVMQAQAPVAASHSPSKKGASAQAPALAKGASPAAAAGAPANDDILEDIFLESPALLETAKDLTDACERMLTLAMQKMTCEHGAVFLRENPGKPLICAAAAGALANAISRIELSSSAGLASVSLQTGVSLSVTNPSTDSRYTPDFARAGVQERSMLLASVHDESTFGVILLFNRNQPNGFSTVDASALAYVGRQLGEYIQSLIDAQ